MHAFTFQSLDSNLMISKTGKITLEWVITLHIGPSPETGQQAVYVVQETFDDATDCIKSLTKYFAQDTNVYVTENTSITSLEGPMYICDIIIKPNDTFAVINDNKVVFSFNAVKPVLERYLEQIK
jgi:hypothetical protein